MKEDAVTKVGANAPSWLAAVAKEDDSLSLVKEHRRLSRLKIAQGNSANAKALIKKVGEGSVILTGTETVVGKAYEKFKFVPLFFFREYCKWRDREDKETPAVIDKDFDVASALAMRAKDKDRRWEVYEDGRKNSKGDALRYRYVEHLTFPGVLYPAMTPVTVSFEKGEHFTGENFCGALCERQVGEDPAPIYTQVWEFCGAEHEFGGNTWWGYDFSNPENPDELFITEEQYPAFKELHDKLKQDYNAKALDVDREDADEEGVTLDDPEL